MKVHRSIGPMAVVGRRQWLLGVLGALGGCGVGSGGTGVGAAHPTYVVGTISGFGSVIVNGVRFDDAGASITSDDGARLAASDLGLGMRASLTASAITTASDGVQRAAASSIVVRSDIIGPVEAVDAVASSLVVLGQFVEILATTVFDDRTTMGLAGLAVADVVEVHAVFDVARRVFVATRVSRPAGVSVYKLRAAIDSVSIDRRTLTIGAAVIDWNAVAPANPSMSLVPGAVIRVTLATTPAGAAWRATSLSLVDAMLEDRERVEVEGRVTAFTSISRFEIEGLAVDASGALFPNGSAGVVLGARVEVEGSVRGGVIVAQVVDVEGEDDDGEGDVELHGVIESVDAPARRFVVRGVTVAWTESTRFDSSTAADIVAGRRVEARGSLSADGTYVEASLIHVER